MKKLSVLFAALLIVALAGSGSSPASQTQQAVSDVPDWLEEIPPRDVFWGIGSARLQDNSLAMETAAVRAQREVARQISVLVQGQLTDFAAAEGLVGNSREMQAIQSVGRNLVNMNLSGASPNKRTRMPDGTWYVRVEMLKGDAKGAINAAVNNEMASYAQFRADEALRQLDFTINNAQITPQVRSAD